jgi:two-component system, OmpR family, response regulator
MGDIVAKNGRILVIDDSDVVLARVNSELSAAGYEVVATRQTVGAARHLPGCELVILDYHMPGIDGRAVLDSLRAATSSWAKAPFFYLYTSDRAIGPSYRRLGFDGAFSGKGGDATLARQVDAAFRLIRLRALAKRDPKG